GQLPAPLAGVLDGREQESHKHADDRDDDQELDERESQAATRGNGHDEVSVISVRECGPKRAKVIIAEGSKKCQRSQSIGPKRGIYCIAKLRRLRQQSPRVSGSTCCGSRLVATEGWI